MCRRTHLTSRAPYRDKRPPAASQLLSHRLDTAQRGFREYRTGEANHGPSVACYDPPMLALPRIRYLTLLAGITLQNLIINHCSTGWCLRYPALQHSMRGQYLGLSVRHHEVYNRVALMYVKQQTGYGRVLVPGNEDQHLDRLSMYSM